MNIYILRFAAVELDAVFISILFCSIINITTVKTATSLSVATTTIMFYFI